MREIQDEGAAAISPCGDDIAPLVRDLASEDGLRRKQARRCLVRRGEEAVEPLIRGLGDADPVMRTESAEALLYIASPRAAGALVTALDDVEFGVRWLAAEALIALKCEGLIPLLEGITRNSASMWFRQAAHHVLHDHYCERFREEIAPVLAALSGRDAEDTAPVAAGDALQRIVRDVAAHHAGRE